MKKFILSIIFTVITVFSYSQSANNLCAGALPTSTTGGCVGGAIIVADQDNIAGCAGCQGAVCNQHKDVWYSFVATANTFTFTLTGGSLVNGEVILVSSTGPCTGLVIVGSTCGALPITGTYSGLVSGTTYYVIIAAPGNQTGTFTLCTNNFTPPGVDCSTATQVCSNSPFAGNSTGFGTQELNAGNQGCLTIEHQSSWYIINISISGTLTMTIAPGVGVDYDYALWGPNPTCPPTVPPVRCSFASGFITNFNTGSYNTGIGGPGTEPSDGTGGTLDGWTNTINVTAGQTYVLLIDNFTANSTPFNLNWGGTAILNCSPLPIELLSFKGSAKNGYNDITWSTATETNNDYFTLERSNDASTWETVRIINGAGNSVSTRNYEFQDYGFISGVDYYRLSQTDFNGQKETFNIIAVENRVVEKKVVRITNLLGQEMEPGYEGLRIIYYSDGTVIKKMGK